MTSIPIITTITIKILAEDIRTSVYLNIHDCPITRALNRIGIEAHDAGGEIYADFDNTVDKTYRNNRKLGICDRAGYETLLGMFKYLNKDFRTAAEPIEPADFDLEIINDPTLVFKLN